MKYNKKYYLLICLVVATVVCVKVFAIDRSDSDVFDEPFSCGYAEIMRINGEDNIVFPIGFIRIGNWLDNESMILSPFITFNYQLTKEHVVRADNIIKQQIKQWEDSMRNMGITRLGVLEKKSDQVMKQYRSAMGVGFGERYNTMPLDSIVIISISNRRDNSFSSTDLQYFKDHHSIDPTNYNNDIEIYVNLTQNRIMYIP